MTKWTTMMITVLGMGLYLTTQPVTAEAASGSGRGHGKTLDRDHDGLLDAAERGFGTHPRRADSDGDGGEAEARHGRDGRTRLGHP